MTPTADEYDQLRLLEESLWRAETRFEQVPAEPAAANRVTSRNDPPGARKFSLRQSRC